MPEGTWRWPNFSPAEIACRGTGKLFVNELALDKLQALRNRLGKPLIVRSAYRSPEHNRAVGGATRSKHLDGAAFDIALTNHEPVAFEAVAREVGFLGFGFYPRSGFIHVDLGPARQWGERFPVRATAFLAETPPAHEVLADSRTMRGGGAAGVAMLGAAGVEVAQSVLAETQTAVLPLDPYLDTLRWVFIAVALGGIAVTIYARLDDWRRGRRRSAPCSAVSPRARGCGWRCATAPSRWRCTCSCWRFGGPASERDASPNALRQWKRSMWSNAMLEAAVRRPRGRNELAERLRDGSL